MKIVVIGGTGRLGSKVVDKLRDHGDEAVAASPNTGVNTLTGEGLAEALTDADAVVDVSNSPSFEDDPAMEFFTKSTTNLGAAAKTAGIRHYVAVSIVGADQLPKSGYLRAKVAQEKLIEESKIPYSIGARHPVRRVHRRDHSLDDGRRRSARTGRVDPAHRRRRPRSRGRPCGRRRTTGWHREHRRA